MDHINWQTTVELTGLNAIILVCKDNGDGDEFELLQLFRLESEGRWAVDCPLANMSAEYFDPANYDKMVIVDTDSTS